ncbi:MAG: neutral trehalase [Proteobacteria bacterium]|nr:neutral trehalase [Pseudomonadota bacterium]MBI3496256.1 neutral trehalase [Pseudomonadota bacterium]
MKQAERKASDLDASAHAILSANDRGGYSVPNGKVYPFQWNWDAAFIAFGYASFDRARAWQELDMLFLGQWDDGMVPSIVFHKPAENYYPGPAVWGTRHMPPTTGITQPPVAATAARVLLQSGGEQAQSQERARGLFPKLLASHRWWHETRDPDASGLVTIVHPWETGRDNSPEWDEPLARIEPRVEVSRLRKDKTHVNASERPTDDFYNRVMTLVEDAKALGWRGEDVARRSSFRVCDIGIQSILLRADRDLLAMARHFGLAREADAIAQWIERSLRAFPRLLHQDGIYRSLDHRTGELAPIATSAGFLPLYARAASAAEAGVLSDHLHGWAGSVRYLVPSTAPSAEAFDPVRYWRGPTWLPINRILADGFAAYGDIATATRIRRDSRHLVESVGLWEYYHPMTGAGLGGGEFSWTAAMWLAWIGNDSQPDILTEV